MPIGKPQQCRRHVTPHATPLPPRLQGRTAANESGFRSPGGKKGSEMERHRAGVIVKTSVCKHDWIANRMLCFCFVYWKRRGEGRKRGRKKKTLLRPKTGLSAFWFPMPRLRAKAEREKGGSIRDLSGGCTMPCHASTSAYGFRGLGCIA